MTNVGVWRVGRRLLLIGAVLLAAYLRLNHLGWTEFKLDEANLSRLALNLVRGVEFPLTGLGSSTGIVNLPLAAWLLAIPYAISPSPIVATGFVAALNVIAVAGCYGLARRWLRSASGGSASGDASHRDASHMSALLAALLFAVAPWAVIHSRKVWAQDLLSPFVIAWAWTGWLAFVKGRPRVLIGHALALAVCIQLHYSALWLIPVTLVWAIAFARRLRWKFALAAAAVFAATFAPFVIADALSGGPNLNRLVEIAGQPAAVDDQALRLAWLMITGQEIHSLAGPQAFQQFLSGAPGGEAGFALGTLIGVLVVAGGLAALIDTLRVRAARRQSFDDRSAAMFMMLTWLVLPVLLQSRHSLPIFTHYFIILYPVPFMLIGSLYVRLSPSASAPSAFLRLRSGQALRGSSRDASHRGAFHRVGRWGLVVFAVSMAALQSIQSIALQEFVAVRATPGGHGVPLEMTLRLAATIERANREANGAEALIYAEGEDPFAHEGPAVLDVLLPPNLPRRFVDLAQATIVYPRDAAVIVQYSPQGLALPNALADRSRLRRHEAVVPLRLGETAAQVRDWPGQAAVSLPCDRAVSLAQWANGITLLHVRPSGEWRESVGWIELCYRVGTEQRQTDTHWFNHLIGPDERRWAQVDGPGYPTGSWRAGDVIQVRFGPFMLPDDAPPGRYALRIGMYTYPAVVTVPLVDAAGNPAGDGVTVELDNPIR